MTIEDYDDLDPEFQEMLDEDEKEHMKPSFDEINLGDLFTGGFMESHTDFDSIEVFIQVSNYNAQELNRSILERKTNEEMDEFVRQSTDFDGWMQMINQALAANADDDLLI
jgi:hypothetical protein